LTIAVFSNRVLIDRILLKVSTLLLVSDIPCLQINSELE
jgi:hypothetical protein